jgi:hypothetical protein
VGAARRRLGAVEVQLGPQLVEDGLGAGQVDLLLELVLGDGLDRIVVRVGRGHGPPGLALGHRHRVGHRSAQPGDRLVGGGLQAGALPPGDHRQPCRQHGLQPADVLGQTRLGPPGALRAGRCLGLQGGRAGAGVAQPHGEHLGGRGPPGRLRPLAGQGGLVRPLQGPLGELGRVVGLGGRVVEPGRGVDAPAGLGGDLHPQLGVAGPGGGDGLLDLTPGVGRAERDAVRRSGRWVPHG